MRKLSIFIWGIFFSFLMFGNSFAEQPGTIQLNHAISSFQEYLIHAGLENIQVQLARHQTIWIRYENRRYRNEVTALGIVFAYASECFSFAEQFIIVPKYRNVPLKYIKVDRDIFQQFINNEITGTDFIEHLEICYQPVSEKPLIGYASPNAQSSLLKIDLITSPGVKAQFARPDDPAQLQFNFLTDVSFTMAPGLQFDGQWIIPLYNEFQRKEDKHRVGQLLLSQFMRFPSSTFFTLSAGLFNYGCVGISTQFKRFFWHDRFSLSARLDYLKTNSLNELLQADLPFGNNLSYLFQAQYHFEQINFKTRLTWGQYLLGDRGWRIDIVRQFHELELGFMGIWNQSLEFLTGMTLKVPFPVSRHPYPGKVRIRPPRFIPWNYRYLPCFDGLILNVGDNFEDIAHQFSISFIRANINQLKIATKYVKLEEPNRSESFLAKRGQ